MVFAPLQMVGFARHRDVQAPQIIGPISPLNGLYGQFCLTHPLDIRSINRLSPEKLAV